MPDPRRLRSAPGPRICGKVVYQDSLTHPAELREMGINKLVTYLSIGMAGIVCLVFLLDLVFNIFSIRLIAMDILFILASAFLLWQGVETILELR